ncbi:hypothetical protein CEXT_555501 [Caerostris extrusa]|uniref:Uncharacterized protein n=1 Tax=Caerostris extrusa TaxID=172846 RepID=A0AAV4QHT1_CAEEX|nr:hypothetical protein CEXT_555501 [Caerostris extrusa]
MWSKEFGNSNILKLPYKGTNVHEKLTPYQAPLRDFRKVDDSCIHRNGVHQRSRKLMTLKISRGVSSGQMRRINMLRTKVLWIS